MMKYFVVFLLCIEITYFYLSYVIDQCFNEKNIIDNKDQDIVVESEVKPGNNQTDITEHGAPDLSRWMTNLPESLTKIPVNKLAIPGSHHSGAYYLDVNTPIGSDQPWFLRTFTRWAKDIIIRWSLTQAVAFPAQLQNGVRYFDIRTGYLESADDFLFIHGVYGYPIAKVLEQMKNFLTANPREIVIVDFNHFYSFTDSLHQRYTNIILAIFDGMIYNSNNTGGVSFTLSDIWTMGKQVIIRYTNDTVANQHVEFWPTDVINDPWLNTDSISTLISKLNENFNNLQGEKFNVFQAILSPQTKTILGSFGGDSLRKTLTVKANIALKKWLADVYAERKDGVNIVMCDFIYTDQIAPAIIKLNEIKN